jgi:hypothetical protein
MIEYTLTVAEVAEAKGVTESAIRAVLNNPKNKTLRAIKCGGELRVLASSLDSYSPREYKNFARVTKLGLQQGKQTRELKPGLVETSVLCPACHYDFFLLQPNGIALSTCPACCWPDLTRRVEEGEEK